MMHVHDWLPLDNIRYLNQGSRVELQVKILDFLDVFWVFFLFMDHLYSNNINCSVLIFALCLCYIVLSAPCSLVVTCWERADLLTLLCVVFSCVLSLSHMVSRVRCGTCCIDS